MGLPRDPQHSLSCSLGMTWPYHSPTVYRNDVLFTHKEVGFVSKNKDKGDSGVTVGLLTKVGPFETAKHLPKGGSL